MDDTPPRALARSPIGVVPIIWNNADLRDLRPLMPALEVIGEMERLGFAGTQLGIDFPAGVKLADELAAHHLRLAEVYAAFACHADGPAPGALDIARHRLAELHAAGGEVLVVALDRCDDRDDWVGRAGRAPGLTDAGWRSLGDLLDTLAGEAIASGHQLAFHNHGGTYVETPDELERLASITDPRLVGLCLDVGHAILGGGDPVAMLHQHGERVIHVHLKDVAAEPLRALREGTMTGFAAALRARIFAPLGGGVLELPSVVAALASLHYGGWLMVEQDSSWEPPSEAAAIGRRVLDAVLRWMPAPAPRVG